MYTAMDEEVFLAPESIISGVLASEMASDPTDDLDLDSLVYGDWVDAREPLARAASRSAIPGHGS